ncbi:CidA/LrgA family protein [Paenibacillus athensensis]|uniref:CidA/LrgA family protein n=1 Tax=Paenibacillus athensensis TaxID=1967502 RepID=A0A4Y8Q730_9BACL|nr:CidA/LrgA family protein [Paenibacillus athensensis]MCD1257446.1 CidA/LrgA family protein [Paenibacillus athensensis]
MLGFAILLAFNLIGVWLQTSLHVPLPGNVIGLVLFTVALFAKVVKLEWVETAATWLTRHMLLYFMPFVVGSVALFPLLGAQWLAVLGGVVGTTTAVLVVTGWTASTLRKRSVGPMTALEEAQQDAE